MNNLIKINKKIGKKKGSNVTDSYYYQEITAYLFPLNNN